jgi:hypothetical protein
MGRNNAAASWVGMIALVAGCAVDPMAHSEQADAGTGGSAAGGSATGGSGPSSGGDYQDAALAPWWDPTFDPTVLAIDAGPAADGGGEPSTALVIFDRSGSMAEGWTMGADTEIPDSGVTVTKWVAASRALLESLAPVQHRVTVAALLFPMGGMCSVAPLDDASQIGFLPAPEFITRYVAESPYHQPDGNTPLEAAFEAADIAIQSAEAQGRLQQRFFVMLLTDGEPNCDSDLTRVEALAQSWLARGIQTHVFGLPGSEDAHAVLDSVAQAGGTETISVPGSPEELGYAMQSLY